MSTAAKPQAQADFLNGAPHRKHPGITNIKTLRLPEKLQVAAQSIIHRAHIRHLEEKAQSLTNFLWYRKRQIEDRALRQKAATLERELWSKVAEKHKGRDVDEQDLEERIQKKVIDELKRTTYHWKQMKFDEETGVVYMAARLAGGYAAVRRALNEIKKRDESFAPESLLDFGSGLGTVAWASQSCWPESLKEFVCVDSSGSMNTLAERLLKGDDEGEEPHFKHVYFRQFLPVSPKVQFDLVVAAYTLSELPNAANREDVVFTLWRKTSAYLVLVENGTKEGHQILMEARDALLNKEEKEVLDSRPASMFAPCPHELTCPKLAQRLNVPCNFQQRYHTLSLPGQTGHLTEKFSYVILARVGAKVSSSDPGLDSGLDWARLIAPVQARTRHVHCRLCCSDGNLQHVVVTARKHGRDLYRCARSSEWGDQIPMIPNKTDENVPSDSEE